jgi:hypothetical protein
LAGFLKKLIFVGYPIIFVLKTNRIIDVKKSNFWVSATLHPKDDFLYRGFGTGLPQLLPIAFILINSNG